MNDEIPKALHFTFHYRGTDIQVQSVDQVDTPALPSDTTAGHEQHAGFWVEVRAATGELVYRRVMQNPVRHEIETHAPDEDGRTRHHQQPLDNPEGIFTLLIPDFDESHTLLMFNSPELDGPIDPSRPPGPAREVARFSLPVRSK